MTLFIQKYGKNVKIIFREHIPSNATEKQSRSRPERFRWRHRGASQGEKTLSSTARRPVQQTSNWRYITGCQRDPADWPHQLRE